MLRIIKKVVVCGGQVKVVPVHLGTKVLAAARGCGDEGKATTKTK